MSDWWTNIVHTGGPVRVHDDDADPDYTPPPFLGFQPPPPRRRLSAAFYDPARVLTFDPLPVPVLRAGDRIRVRDVDGSVVFDGTYQPLPTVTIDEPRVEWYGSGSGSRLVEHLLVAIADQDPDEWGDQG